MTFVPVSTKSMAEEVKFILENITGDRIIIVSVGDGHGRHNWIIQRWTGSVWVEG